MILRPPRSTHCISSAASDVYKRQGQSSRSYLDHECTRHIVSWWYTHVQNMVSQCQSKKSFGPDTKTCQKLYKFGQSSRLYLDHECTWHSVLWWYTHVQNMVNQCQSKKKVIGWTQTDGQTDGQTDRQSDSYIPPWTSFTDGIITVSYTHLTLPTICTV